VESYSTLFLQVCSNFNAHQTAYQLTDIENREYQDSYMYL